MRQPFFALLFVLVLTLLGLSLSGWRSAASWLAPPIDSGKSGLTAALNPDGTLKPGASGNFDARGFRLEYSPGGAPRFVAAPLMACNGWDTQFSLNGVSNASNSGADAVLALAVSGTDVYVGGIFKIAGNVAANRVAKFNTLTNTWSVLGTGGGNGVDNDVNALALSGTDLYVGGEFTTANVGGTTVSANRVAKFNTLTGVWSALGTNGNGVNSFVGKLALSGSDLYVGGLFTTANVGGTTVNVNNIAKVNTMTGVWSKLGTGIGNGVDAQVTALLVSGSDLFVGGVFVTANLGGTTVSANHIAKLDTLTGVWSVLGTGSGNGVDAVVTALVISGNDLYVGGGFITANVGGTTISARRVAKVNTITGVWSNLGTGGGNGVSLVVTSLALSGNDLYLGGNFTTANVGGPTVSVNNIAKVNTTTGVWSALGTDGNGADGLVADLLLSGSNLYLGGKFTMANLGGTTVSANRVAKFNTTTNIFSALGTGNGVNDGVNALVVSGSDLYVGGDFTFAGNVAVNHVAKFNTLTNTWSALGTGGGNGVDSTVLALAVSGSDLYVGGAFTTANVGGATVSVNRVAKFNTLTGVWSKLGTDGNGVNDTVKALAVSGSDLFVGGNFSIANVGGTIVLANIVAKFNTTTGVWSKLGTDGNGVNNSVNALAVSGSDLYVGGAFTLTNFGGTTVSANRVAKVNTTTGVWSTLGTNGNGVNGTVIALALSGSDLYVGGLFGLANFGGTTVITNNIAKVNTTTGVWSKLGTDGNGLSHFVNALLVSGTDLYVGGQLITTANFGGMTVSTNRVAKFDTTTGAWSALADAGGGNGVDTFGVTALAVGGSDLYVGGFFFFAGDNKVSQNIGRFCGNNLLGNTVTTVVSSSNPSAPGQAVTFTSTVTPVPPAVGSPTGTVQFKDNGSPIGSPVGLSANGLASVTTSSLTIGTHVITAEYAGDAVFNGSTGSVTQEVTILTSRLADALACTGTGAVVSGLIQLANPNGTPQPFTLTTTFTNLVGLSGTCVITGAQAGAVCSVSANGLTITNGIAPANSTVSVQYQAQIADAVSGGSVSTSSVATIGATTLPPVVATLPVNCPPAGPGALPNAQNQLSDQKAGSVLLYPVYTSDAANGSTQNTRVSITNVHPSRAAFVHLFFVDGTSCSVADSYICLTANQTATVLTSDIDPGTTGYIVAVATDRIGCPINFNYLIGDEYVKFASGHAANLGAEAVSAIAGGLTTCNLNSVTAQLNFDGVSYNALPRVLASSNLPSRGDGNDTLFIVDRIGGNLSIGAATIGTLFGLLYDDAERAFSFQLPAGTCQTRGSITNDRPRTVPRFETVIPAGRSGWLKAWGAADIGIIGAQINRNPNSGSSAGAFNQGHNLHKLTLTTSANYVIPIFPPSC